MEPWVLVATIMLGANIILWSTVFYLVREQRVVNEK